MSQRPAALKIGDWWMHFHVINSSKMLVAYPVKLSLSCYIQNRLPRVRLLIPFHCYKPYCWLLARTTSGKVLPYFLNVIRALLS